MMWGSAAIVIAVGCAVGCQTAPPADRNHPARSCKPEAPVVVEVAHRAVGPDMLEIQVRATPARATGMLELGVALPQHAVALGPVRETFGATAAHQTRSFVTTVRADDRASELSGFARIAVDDVVMSRASRRAIGRAPVPVPAVVYALADGELVREVRP